MGWMTKDSGFNSWQGQEVILFSRVSGSAADPASYLASGAPAVGVKHLGV